MSVVSVIQQHARRSHSAIVAACLTAGIWAGDSFVRTPVVHVLMLLALVLLSACVCSGTGRNSLARPGTNPGFRVGGAILLWAGCFLVGVLLHHQHFDGRSVGSRPAETDNGAVTLRAEGIVRSIPALRTKRETWRSAHSTAAPAEALQTVFLCELCVPDDQLPPDRLSSCVRVIVNGDAVNRITWGDRIELLGRLETSFPLNNPGEFDYQRFLNRHRLCGVMFVQHPQAMTVISAQPSWHPTVWLTRVRKDASTLIRQHLDSSSQPIAEALLLGNRGHMETSAEHAFIASGTMHLLAISGLHTGILFVFLLRVLNGLLVEHRRALIIATACCVFYAFLTDLRPSVLRATLFIGISAISQLFGREIRMPTLIGNTVILLLLFDPGMVFDVGAWLSFLAVAALAWTGSRQSSAAVRRETPPDAIGWHEWLQENAKTFRRRLFYRYRQMLAVTLFSMPVVTSQFHMVSLSGMFLNIVLIPLTGLTMIAGFVFLGAGLLIPPAASICGLVFSGGLNVLSLIVDGSTQLQGGWLSIADLPSWFLPAFYGLLALLVIVPRYRWQNRVLAVQLSFVLLAFHQACHAESQAGLSCTILSVGHGNSTVVITPDNRVLVCDAGSLHRSERTAHALARYLWHRGHRQIDTLMISHADADHYNSVVPLLDLMPIGQLMTTVDFVQSKAAPVRELLQEIRQRRIPVSLVHSLDQADLGAVQMQFFKATSSRGEPLNDNELSLMARVELDGRSIAIPGDLDGTGFRQLANDIPPSDVLVSPHHGSLPSNTARTAQVFQPDVLIVSSRTDQQRDALAEQFPDARHQFFTATDGAVRVDIVPGQPLHVRSLRHESD